MAKSIIKFVRLRDVDLPERGHKHDAGIDFFVPRFDKSFVKDLKVKNPHFFNNQSPYDGACYTTTGALSISGSDGSPKIKFELDDPNDSILKYDENEGKTYIPLAPMQRINIPSGIYCKMEDADRALIAHNKSGVASKKGLVFGAQVVDYEYQGEIHINVINTSSKLVRVYEEDKLMQFIEIPIFTSEIEEVVDLPTLYPEGETSRAEGGFGSTDKKDVEQLNS
jgi:dUTPase